MAGEVVQQQAMNTASSGINIKGAIIVLLVIAVIAVFIYVIYKALKKREEYEDTYLKHYNLVRELTLQGADPRFFSSQWRCGNNARIYRVFEENGKRQRMNLNLGPTSYMGHILSKQGVCYLAFCDRKSLGLLPVIEVLMLPLEAVHFYPHIGQIDVLCNSIDRLTKSFFFLPVYKTKDGSIIKDAFDAMDIVWKERIAADVIREQGTSAVELANRMPSLNARVQFNRKNKPMESE